MWSALRFFKALPLIRPRPPKLAPLRFLSPAKTPYEDAQAGQFTVFLFW